jgi:hypothetical protein
MIRMNALAPTPSTGSDTEREMTDAIARLATAGDNSAAEMLQILRQQFPHSPLAARVRALDALRKR